MIMPNTFLSFREFKTIRSEIHNLYKIIVYNLYLIYISIVQYSLIFLFYFILLEYLLLFGLVLNLIPSNLSSSIWSIMFFPLMFS